MQQKEKNRVTSEIRAKRIEIYKGNVISYLCYQRPRLTIKVQTYQRPPLRGPVQGRKAEKVLFSIYNYDKFPANIQQYELFLISLWGLLIWGRRYY